MFALTEHKIEERYLRAEQSHSLAVYHVVFISCPTVLYRRAAACTQLLVPSFIESAILFATFAHTFTVPVIYKASESPCLPTKLCEAQDVTSTLGKTLYFSFPAQTYQNNACWDYSQPLLSCTDIRRLCALPVEHSLHSQQGGPVIHRTHTSAPGTVQNIVIPLHYLTVHYSTI